MKQDRLVTCDVCGLSYVTGPDTRTHNATHAKLVACNGCASKPTLHLFGNGKVEPHGSSQAAETPAPVHAAPEPEVAAPAAALDRGNDRYRWRCTIMSMFGRRYRPDKERMKQARDFAYSKRAIIHAAFDAGELKTAVLGRLGELFETSRTPE
jgi:hypothetical protein